MAKPAYAELHCHTNFSFLDGASTGEDLVERAVELGLSGLAVTDHRGLYGVVRFVSAAEAAGLHPVVGLEIELRDAAVPEPAGVVIPARRRPRRGSSLAATHPFPTEPAEGRLRIGDRAGARAVAERYARAFGSGRSGRTRGTAGVAAAGFVLELEHHLLPDDDWLVAETVALAEELGLPGVVTNDVHYARPEDREMHDVLTAIHHGRTLDTLADLRRPDSESYLKSTANLMALPPASDPATSMAWSDGLANAAELAAGCSVDLG